MAGEENNKEMAPSEQSIEEFANAISSIIEPMIKQLDERAEATRQSQEALRETIDSLAQELETITANSHVPYDLHSYAEKLSASRKRVNVAASIINNANERLVKLQRIIDRYNAAQSKSPK